MTRRPISRQVQELCHGLGPAASNQNPMSDSIALAILWAAAVYGGVGICFAIAFVARGLQIIDPVAQHAGIAFRIALIPGAAALWPLLLRRWILTGEKT